MKPRLLRLLPLATTAYLAAALIAICDPPWLGPASWRPAFVGHARLWMRTAVTSPLDSSYGSYWSTKLPDTIAQRFAAEMRIDWSMLSAELLALLVLIAFLVSACICWIEWTPSLSELTAFKGIVAWHPRWSRSQFRAKKAS